MNRPLLTRSLMVGAVAAGLVVATPLAAGAAAGVSTTPKSTSNTSGSNNSGSNNSGARFDVLRSILEGALSLRQAQLSSLTGEVNGSMTLTASDKAELQSELASETAGIDSLASKVPNDTTFAELKADSTAMVTDYRVFVVMSPKTHCTLAADTETAIAQRMQGLEPQLQAAINEAQQHGINVTGAQAAYDALVGEVSSAGSADSGVSSACLATTPAGWPGDATVFVGAKGKLVSGRADLVSARNDIATILKDIR